MARRRRTIEERTAIVSRMRASGLSATAFAKREGLVLSSVLRWVREAKKVRPVFTEVIVEPAMSVPMVIHTPSGYRVEVEHSGELADVAALARSLG